MTQVLWSNATLATVPHLAFPSPGPASVQHAASCWCMGNDHPTMVPNATYLYVKWKMFAPEDRQDAMDWHRRGL